MNNYTIAITTFSLRYDMLQNLVVQIRSFTDRNILICINGEKDGKFDDEYRYKVLALCASFKNIFPIFFIELRGLSKMWNTLIVHSDNDHIMMLNEDIIIQSEDIFTETQKHINSDFNGLTILNSSFSHYILDRKLIDSLGYFDERLLGFGEEDGDIVYRLLKSYGQTVPILWVNGLHNIISEIRHTEVKKGSAHNMIHKYTDFNRKFILGTKYVADPTSPYKGFFDEPMKQILPNEKIYPYEKFFWENKNKIFN